MKSRNDEYVPNRPIWLLFDTSNGHAPTRRYVWWFDTRKDAVREKKWKNSNEENVKLAGPFRFVPEKE